MNNSLRYLVVVSLALGFTTSVVCAEAAVQVAQEVSKVEVEASVVALMTTKTEAPEVKVEAPVAPVTTNSFISRSFATVSGAATGSLTALSGVIVAHPVIAAAGLTVTTVVAVYAISQWKKAAERAAVLEEELALRAVEVQVL